MDTKLKNLFLLCTLLATTSVETHSKQNLLPKKYESKIIHADKAFEQGVHELSQHKYKEAKHHFETAQAKLLENIQLLEYDMSEKSNQLILDILDSLKTKAAYTQAALDALHYQINKINTKEAVEAYSTFADLNNLYKAAESKLHTIKKDALATLHKQSKIIAHYFKNAALELSMILDKAVQKVEKEEYKTEKAMKKSSTTQALNDKDQNKYKC